MVNYTCEAMELRYLRFISGGSSANNWVNLHSLAIPGFDLKAIKPRKK